MHENSKTNKLTHQNILAKLNDSNVAKADNGKKRTTSQVSTKSKEVDVSEIYRAPK